MAIKSSERIETKKTCIHVQVLSVVVPVQMDKNRPGISVKPFDIPVLPLMTQHGPTGAFSHSPSSVAGISSGLGGMSINSSAQSNQASQGQYGPPNQATQGQYGQPNQASQGQYGQPHQASQGQYGQPNQASQGQYGQPMQSSGANSQSSQGVAGYSPLSDWQHGQLPQSGQGQYGQSGQGQYGQPNQPGQGQYGQTGQGQYSQAGQGRYGQPHQATQPGQTAGGFDTYPDMSSNNQPFDGNKPYSSPNGNGAEQCNQNQGGQQQLQQQGQNGSYAAYPDLGHGNTTGYNQAGNPIKVC